MGDAVLALSSYDVSKNVLHAETTRLASIMTRVGRRLKNHIGKLDGRGVPDEGTRETLRWYKDAVLGLLKEERERARFAAASGLNEIPEAEHQEALDAFRRETMLEMSDEEMAKLVDERAKARATRH